MKPRVDLSFPRGTDVREALWWWRHDITQQVVNPDIDGLLTACLLHHLKGWKVAGFYDTASLLLEPRTPLPLDLRATIFVDADMCWPGARSLSQHVVRESPDDRDHVVAFSTTLNPSLDLGPHSRQQQYRSKYPFGTFQWAWWLAGRAAAGPPPSPHDRLRTGLAWMPDGGFESVRGVWHDNCLSWAVERMPDSIMSPLARTDPASAFDLVVEASETLRSRSGVAAGWRNHQFTLTKGSASGPVPTMDLEEGLESMQSLCDVICEIYEWDRVTLPRQCDVHTGKYNWTSTPPPGWPDSANRGEVVSLAVTSKDRLCWTSPRGLEDVLPDPRR